MRRRNFIKIFSTLAVAVVAAPKLLAQKVPRVIRFFRYNPLEIPALMGWKPSFKVVTLNPTATIGIINYKVKDGPRTIGWEQYLMRTRGING